jgi:hypothetical protein
MMKICPVGAELFHADGQTDGQTDMTKPIVAFRDITNVPKKKFETHGSCYWLKQVMEGHSMATVYGRYSAQLLVNASNYKEIIVLTNSRHPTENTFISSLDNGQVTVLLFL